MMNAEIALNACGQVWRRAMEEGEEQLCEMNRILADKTAHQRSVISKLQQYVRVHGNGAQTAADTSASVDDAVNSETEADDGDDTGKPQPDPLSAQLSTLVDSLKAMTAESVQVS